MRLQGVVWGYLRVWGVFSNKDELLFPGFFARVCVPIGRAHRALLVTDRAVDTDQGQKVLYVVNEKNAEGKQRQR
jgi:hypothetical protein